jgi:hypothetical protein
MELELLFLFHVVMNVVNIKQNIARNVQELAGAVWKSAAGWQPSK